jgi:hypothetical protein
MTYLLDTVACKYKWSEPSRLMGLLVVDPTASRQIAVTRRVASVVSGALATILNGDWEPLVVLGIEVDEEILLTKPLEMIIVGLDFSTRCRAHASQLLGPHPNPAFSPKPCGYLGYHCVDALREFRLRAPLFQKHLIDHFESHLGVNDAERGLGWIDRIVYRLERGIAISVAE